MTQLRYLSLALLASLAACAKVAMAPRNVVTQSALVSGQSRVPGTVNLTEGTIAKGEEPAPPQQPPAQEEEQGGFEFVGTRKCGGAASRTYFSSFVAPQAQVRLSSTTVSQTRTGDQRGKPSFNRTGGGTASTQDQVVWSASLPAGLFPKDGTIVVPRSVISNLPETERPRAYLAICDSAGDIKCLSPGHGIGGGYELAGFTSSEPTSQARVAGAEIPAGQVRIDVWNERLQNPTAAQREAMCDYYTASPLVLDLDGDRIALVGPERGPRFDVDGDGEAGRTGWVASGRDALLALDLNYNGKIDGGGELFGNATRLADGSLAENGFEALAQYDSNGDGEISAADRIFGQLRLWLDHDLDGETDPGELVPLAREQVRSISLRYMPMLEIDEHGNETRQRSVFLRGNRRQLIVDVWFLGQ